MSKAGSRFMGLVKQLPCIVCAPGWYDQFIQNGETYKPHFEFISDFDHFVDGYRLGDEYGFALCYEHHRGNKGYSGKYCDWDKSKKNQWLLVEKTYKVLGLQMPVYESKIVRRRT